VPIIGQLSVSAIESGIPLVAAFIVHGIPRRTIRDYVNREGSPLKKIGRNAVLPADVEKQLQQRTMLLQQVGFGLTRNNLPKFSVQVCKEHSFQNPLKGGIMRKY
jgi:hypothetical protein